MNDYLDLLNPAQKAAVLHQNGAMMIIAGAGSGKTRVLTYRVAHLINEGVNPYQILVLTFTKKAANEMKERISSVVGAAYAKAIWMGTFHAVFARILRSEAEILGYPKNFTIYDTIDSRRLITDIIKELHLDKDQYKASRVFSRISKLKNNLITVNAYFNTPEERERDAKAQHPKIGDIYKAYVDRCFKAGAMDFDDLLLKTNELFFRFKEVREKYQQHFQYIMVDEYQDTNYSQYLIVKAIAEYYKNIAVVGDDAQSIYSFRGADITNILNFKKDYPEAQTFKLEQNYRSSNNIVSAADTLIKKNKNRLEKDIWTANDNGEKINIIRNLSDNEEAKWLARNTLKIIEEKQINYKDFGVLYRTNVQSRPIEEAFRKNGVPYKIYGGQSFYDRKEIKDTLAYLRLIVNQNDEDAFKRVINYPARGIGATTLNRILLGANEHNISPFEILSRLDEFHIQLNSNMKNKLLDFAQMIKVFQADELKKNAFEVAKEVIQATKIVSTLEKEGAPKSANRVENIQELLSGIQFFVKEREESDTPPTLSNFLEDVALSSTLDDDDQDKNKVNMMTIHLSKGLEFSYVYIVGMEENLFPSAQALNNEKDIEEERRLCYVAMTRAEKKLYLSYANTRYRWGKLINCQASRFLDEIDKKYIEKVEHKHSFMSGGSIKRTTPTANKIKIISKTSVKKPVNRLENHHQKATQKRAVVSVKKGDVVKHERFGKGTIENIEGTGADEKATILFEEKGRKRILLRFAKLDLVKK